MTPDPPRPDHARHVYIPQNKPEYFMIPLLKGAILQALETYATHPKPAKCLDVGCGRQPFRGIMVAGGYQYFSLDAQASAEVKIDFVATIDQPQLPAAVGENGPYDFILCTEVLEHVADWQRAFQNIAALLAPGGRVLMTSPHFYLAHEEPYDFWRPTPHAFEYFARKNDLAIVQVQKLGDAWDILGTLLSCCRFEPVNPHSARDALWAKALWKLRNRVFDFIHRGAIRRRVKFHGPLHMSNLAVLEKKRA